MRRLKASAKRSKWLVCIVTVLKDLRARLAARHGAAPSTSGSTHAGFSVDESLAYIDAVYADYLAYGGIAPADLAGQRVLELGPGDNLGVALRFLAAGAASVVALDKFASVRDEEHQRRIYEALIERLESEAKSRAAEAISLDGGFRFEPARLRVIEGVAVEEAGEHLAPESFELIVSRAVLEHLYDLDAAFAAMEDLLRPGGLMLHKVDFRDHGMFTAGGMHPLTFLTVPEPVYRAMTRHSGRPNRHLVDWYRERLDALGYESRMLVTKPVGGSELVPHREAFEPDPETLELVESIRPRLRPRFRELAPEDLAVAGIFLVGRKPGP